MENAATPSEPALTCAGCQATVTPDDDVHCASCVDRIGNEIDAEHSAEQERATRDFNNNASRFVRNWARDKKTLGLINMETVEALELCADDLESEGG